MANMSINYWKASKKPLLNKFEISRHEPPPTSSCFIFLISDQFPLHHRFVARAAGKEIEDAEAARFADHQQRQDLSLRKKVAGHRLVLKRFQLRTPDAGLRAGVARTGLQT